MVFGCEIVKTRKKKRNRGKRERGRRRGAREREEKRRKEREQWGQRDRRPRQASKGEIRVFSALDTSSLSLDSIASRARSQPLFAPVLELDRCHTSHAIDRRREESKKSTERSTNGAMRHPRPKLRCRVEVDVARSLLLSEREKNPKTMAPLPLFLFFSLAPRSSLPLSLPFIPTKLRTCLPLGPSTVSTGPPPPPPPWFLGGRPRLPPLGLCSPSPSSPSLPSSSDS